jgi:hypothetical protein
MQPQPTPSIMAAITHGRKIWIGMPASTSIESPVDGVHRLRRAVSENLTRLERQAFIPCQCLLFFEDWETPVTEIPGTIALPGGRFPASRDAAMDALNQLIDRIYTAATDAAVWPEVMKSLQDEFRCTSVGLYCADMRSGDVSSWNCATSIPPTCATTWIIT